MSSESDDLEEYKRSNDAEVVVQKRKPVMPRNYNDKIMSGKENKRPKRVSKPTFKAQEYGKSESSSSLTT